MIKPGSETDALIGLNDLMATWADIAGIELSDKQAPDSVSFLAVLKDSLKSSRISLVTRGTRSDAFRDGDWKLILGNGSGGRQQPKGKPFAKPYILSNIRADQAETKNHSETESKIASRLEAAFVKIQKNERK